LSKDDIVFPGSFLGYEEEFVAGANAYENDGSLFSDSIGQRTLDEQKHEANVQRFTNDVKILDKDCVVIGIVSLVKMHSVLLDIKQGQKNGQKRTVHDRNGSIAVFNISQSYVKSTDEMYRIGDIVKARVLEVTPYGIELESKAPEFGVIKAFSVKSRAPLHLIDGKLRDPLTGATEERKISSDYLLR